MPEKSFARLGYKNAAGQFVPTDTRAQDVFATTGVSVEEHIVDAEIHLTPAQAAAISGAVQSIALGAANGVATLDENQKLTASQLPNAVLGGLNYRGTFNAATGKDDQNQNIPTASSANKGYYWIANVAGSFSPPGAGAPISFAVGDWLVSNGTSYDEVDNTTVDQTAREAAAAASTAAGSAQTTANTAVSNASTAQSTADSATTAAALLDAAFCANESDMAGKNLRTGAFVLMQVENSAA
jgi:hypothetical protein